MLKRASILLAKAKLKELEDSFKAMKEQDALLDHQHRQMAHEMRLQLEYAQQQRLVRGTNQ